MTQRLRTAQVRHIAYDQTEGDGPGVVFLGGFNSDKEGTKAVYLEGWAQRRRRAYLRFDYSGHGSSSGAFEDGCIGDWAEDAAALVGSLTEGPQILVGSSMGGWIALLLARAMPDKVAGLVTIAAAPDFTEDKLLPSLTAEEREQLATVGKIERPSQYSQSPYVFTSRLIEDGRRNLVLQTPLSLPFPVRLLHGTADPDVDMSVALRLLEHAECPDMRLTLLKDADHRFSTADCLALIVYAIEDVTSRFVQSDSRKS